MDNIQKSELVIAKILGLLMEWGVQKNELTFEELKIDSAYSNFYFPCINWLVAEKVIRVSKIMQFANGAADGLVQNPVLTSHGMRVLGLQISYGDGGITMAEAVKSVQSGDKSYSQFGDFFGGFLGGFTKSLGS
ncbi:MAG: hypothetical protein JKY31_13210 [Rhodobacteraceae bacterium]|nr:hypothetical protein [Paracoccaceae bacterium]